MDFQLPELGEGVYEAELSSWLVKPGDSVEPGQGIIEVLTDKATMEVPSPFAGTIDELLAREGDNVKIGDVVMRYSAKDETQARNPEIAKQKPESQESESAARTSARPSSGNGPATSIPVKAAPSVRLMARKLGVDIARVDGSGPDGRILIEDLSRFLEPSARQQGDRRSTTEIDFGKPGTRIKLQGIRRKIAEHMVHAKRTIPHYGYVDECDLTELVRLRQGLREPYKKAGVTITYLPFFIKAVCGALKDVPMVNASLDEEAGEIVLHDKYHIGIAVATQRGLMVPVLHDADKKDLMSIAREVERLSSDARHGRTKLEELRGGTFAITSIGSIGGLFSTPVIPHPQVGILGIGKIVKRPVYDDAGNIKPADMIYLSFSFDHRVLDGAVGAAFGNSVKRRLENPIGLLVE